MPLATIDTPARTVRLDDLNIVTVSGEITEVVDGNYVVSPRHVPIYPMVIDELYGHVPVECSETEFALHFTEATSPIRGFDNVTVFVTDPNGVGWSQIFTRFTCDHCRNQGFYSSVGPVVPTWCNSCEASIGCCEDCGCLVHEENTYTTDDDARVCRSCDVARMERRDARRNRGQTEARQFFKAVGEQETFVNDRPLLLENHQMYYTKRETTLYMGLELEIEMPDSTTGGVWDNIEELLNNSWGHERYETKTDGSLSNGVEVVTQPHTLAAYEQLDWSVLTRIANLGCRSADTSTCGAHVHISRDSFTNLAHQYRFTQFITRNPCGVKEIAQRISDRWAAYDDAELTLKYLKKELSPQRYKAVNLCNEATLEIRAFKGSLKPERVRAYLQFIHSVHAYTKHLTVTDIRQGALQFSAYRAWLWQHALPTYNEVRLYIREGN